MATEKIDPQIAIGLCMSCSNYDFKERICKTGCKPHSECCRENMKRRRP